MTTRLYTYHAAIDDKEFEFPIEVESSSSDLAIRERIDFILKEAGPTMLEQFPDVLCSVCKQRPATMLAHHPMVFDQVVPPRIEDIPQLLCSNAECFYTSNKNFDDEMRSAYPAAGEKKMCFYCRKEEGETTKLLQCSRCKAAKYCNAACQRSDWSEHKRVCRAPQ